MRKKGRILLALLVCMVCVFGGCGKSDGNTSQTQKEENLQSGGNEEQKDISSGEETDAQEKEVYVQSEMKGEISISCFVEQEFLATAAEQFMDIYPDVTVKINVYNETSGAGSVEDYQTYLNTKVMTGKAEDIIFNSFLPVMKYSEMGVFEDLSRYIALTPDLNDENYFMNVLQAAREESGEIYMIPYMAKFDVVGFSDVLLEEQPGMESRLQSAGFSERMDVAKELVQNTDKNNAFLIMLNEVTYADYLIEDAWNNFVDVGKKEANFNSEAYISFLKEVKELSESNAFDADVDFYNTEYYYAATCDYDVQAAFYELDEQSGLSYSMPLADSEGNVAINANYCLALNSASSNKDLAWEFMKYLLSEKVQSLPSIHGLAVNKNGFEAAAERYYNFYAEGSSGSVDRTEYGGLLQSWMEQINDCDTVDSALWTLIEEENGKFFEGKQTAEDTASVLQRKIEQYFNE